MNGCLSLFRCPILILLFLLPGGLAVSATDRAEPVPDSDPHYEPEALFLTWQVDPTTSMTIDWHTMPQDRSRAGLLEYRAAGSDRWVEAPANFHGFPHSKRMISRVDLRGLTPGTTYHFRFGDNSREYRFRTMPADLDEPIQFAAGGDTWFEEDFRRMNRVVMEYDPEFIVWGGDLSYAHGDPFFLYKWYGWFDGIMETLIDDDGRVVPIVLAIGNHETFSEGQFRSGRRHGVDGYDDQETADYLERYNLWDDKVTFFFDLFAFPGNPAYGVLDFSDYLSLVILDTDHHSPVAGPQTGWLDAVLSERTDRPHLFPVYHVPAYPSHRSFDGRISREVRAQWVPLFERHGVKVALENHDHTYKRTHPVRENSIDEEGIIYLGDGAWVAGPRAGDNRDAWYMDRFASENHAILITLHGRDQNYRVVSIEGELIDEFTVETDAQAN